MQFKSACVCVCVRASVCLLMCVPASNAQSQSYPAHHIPTHAPVMCFILVCKSLYTNQYSVEVCH